MCKRARKDAHFLKLRKPLCVPRNALHSRISMKAIGRCIRTPCPTKSTSYGRWLKSTRYPPRVPASQQSACGSDVTRHDRAAFPATVWTSTDVNKSRTSHSHGYGSSKVEVAEECFEGHANVIHTFSRLLRLELTGLS